MEKAKTANRYSAEVRLRAVRMVLEHGPNHASQWAAIGLIAAKIDCMRIPLILISHSGRSRPPIPVIPITLFTMPEKGTAGSKCISASYQGVRWTYVTPTF